MNSNIRYKVVDSDSDDGFNEFLRDHRNESGVVYCFPRDQIIKTTELLRHQGIKALPYYAGLDEETRQANAQRFMDEEGIVIVASVAFGKGIDKTNVRFVAHLSLPSSLIEYWEKTRLAGRDGQPAEVWMIYGENDRELHEKLIKSQDISMSDDQKTFAYRQFQEVISYCEEKECRRSFLLKKLSGIYSEPCGNCDNCLKKSRLWDGSRYGTNDLEKHKSAVEKVVGIKFSRMGGFGKISCCECSFSENHTSFLHGLRSDGGSNGSSTGYQCLVCGKFAAISSSDSLTCQCGGDLSRDHLLFCPKCKSNKLIYKMKFIT